MDILRTRSSHSSLRRLGATLALTAMLLVALFGSAYIGMSMDGMHTCLFSSGSVLCSMDIREHLSEWLLAFVGPISLSSLMLLTSIAVMLSSALVRPLFSGLRHIPGPVFTFSYIPLPRERERDRLKEAYARGILNSKAY